MNRFCHGVGAATKTYDAGQPMVSACSTTVVTVACPAFTAWEGQRRVLRRCEQ